MLYSSWKLDKYLRVVNGKAQEQDVVKEKMSMYVENAKAEEMLLVQVDVGSLAKMIQVLVERCSCHELMSESSMAMEEPDELRWVPRWHIDWLVNAY
jgi:hypothetical protein